MIKSARKVVGIRSLVGLVLVAVFALPAMLFVSSSNRSPVAVINGQDYQLEVMNTDKLREKGLSGRSGIASSRAMLFSFDEIAPHCMWMKDMNFAIDMIWLNDQSEVVKVLPNVDPATYPKSFCDQDGSRYVLELAAGSAASLKVGTKVQLQNL